jgi:predicted permease
MRQLFTEGVLLAMLALGVFFLMAFWLMYLLRLLDENGEPIMINLFNPRVLVFSLSIALGSILLFQFLPALYTYKMDVVPALKVDRSRHSRLGRRLFGLPVMVVLQLALSLILMVCAGHFLRFYLDAKSMDLGFRNRNVLLAYDIRFKSRRNFYQLFRDLVDNVQTLAGVENVGLAQSMPTRERNPKEYRIFLPDDEVQSEDHGEKIQANIVDPGYFPTMGIPVLSGHNFPKQLGPSDSRQVIVSQAFASRFWPGKNPVGRLIQLEDLDSNNPLKELAQVIGMVQDVRGCPFVYETPKPYLYVPFGQMPTNDLTLLVKTRGNPHLLADPVRKVIQDIDNTMDVFAMTSLAHEVRKMRAVEMVFSLVTGALSLFGMSLACVGIFGIIAFTVTRRTYELGVRMALGARGRDVMCTVLSQGLKLSLIGLGIGLMGSAALWQVLRSIMFDIIPFDLVVFAISSVVVLFVAMLAAYVPARRAAKIDPMEALRYE